AEEIADRVGVINGGELLLVEEKTALMRKLGRKELRLELVEPLGALPSGLDTYHLALAEGGGALIYEYQGEAEQGRIAALLGALTAQGIDFRDLSTRQSSLEDIFVELVGQRA
ncbi:MAG TPA: multidrug ABC transporter ATP-binding protein, partial [Pseudorhizobium sp.]|nr:multidrug ABC transporter ATP-binding protein [Pseudorhizobium sp.]